MHDNKELFAVTTKHYDQYRFQFFFSLAEEYGFQLRTYIKQHLYSMHITRNEMKLLSCCYGLTCILGVDHNL